MVTRRSIIQVLEQLKLEPEAAMLNDALLKQAAAVHTIVPAGHNIGTPQVQTLLSSILAQRSLTWDSSCRTTASVLLTQRCWKAGMTGGEAISEISLPIMQVLFRTIPKEEEDALRLRYAGTQAERTSAAKGKKPADKGKRNSLGLVSPEDE